MPSARPEPRGTSTVAVASLVSAATGYLAIFVAARTLTLAENATFLAFWALLFAFFAVLSGVQNEATRSVKARSLVERPAGSRGASVLAVGLATGATLALVVAATSPLWGARLLGEDHVVLTIALTVGILLFAGHCAVAGALGGSGDWPVFSTLVGAESSMRLLLVVLAFVLGAGLLGLEVASALAAGTWLLLAALSPRARAALRARGDSDVPTMIRHVLHSMLGSAGSAVLVVGFPVALKATSLESEYLAAAPLLLAITLTRAPLLIPLNAYQGVAITSFVSSPTGPRRPLLRISGAILAVGVVGAGLAALVGPTLMAVVLGESYRVSGALLAALTMSGALLAVLTMCGAATLSIGSHRSYALGWIVAAAVSLITLLTPLELEARVILSLSLGPVAGIVVHLASVWTRGPRPDADVSAAEV